MPTPSFQDDNFIRILIYMYIGLSGSELLKEIKAFDLVRLLLSHPDEGQLI